MEYWGKVAVKVNFLSLERLCRNRIYRFDKRRRTVAITERWHAP
jgi:hypothetical protein